MDMDEGAQKADYTQKRKLMQIHCFLIWF